MALGHLSYNQEYMKLREALGYWNGWFIKNIHVPKSPSKLAPKGKGRKKRSTYLVLCPVCSAHCGRCFIHLLTLFSLHYNKMSCRVTEEKTEAQSNDQSHTGFFFNPYPRTCLLILERGEGRERQRERNIDVRENINQLPLIGTPSGIEPAT